MSKGKVTFVNFTLSNRHRAIVELIREQRVNNGHISNKSQIMRDAIDLLAEKYELNEAVILCKARTMRKAGDKNEKMAEDME